MTLFPHAFNKFMMLAGSYQLANPEKKIIRNNCHFIKLSNISRRKLIYEIISTTVKYQNHARKEKKNT